MITVSVLYPNSDGAEFDMDYYVTRHMPMVADKLGSALLRWSAERGLAGATADAPPPYIAAGHLSFNSVEAFQDAFGPHAEEILADLPNFTKLQPSFQISEVTAG